MTRNENRRKRLRSSLICETECTEMEGLKKQWSQFGKSYTNSKRWFIAIIIAIIGMMTPYTIDAYVSGEKAATKEELHEYVKTDEMLSWLLLEMDYVQKLILLEKAEVSDSIINQVYENHKWMLQQFMEYNPRSINPKPNYANILNNYKNRDGYKTQTK